MADSVPLKVSNAYKPTDFDPMLGEIISGVNYKLILFLFLLYIFITSDVFLDRMLSKVDGASAQACTTCTTTYGTIIQGTLLVIGYMIMDILIKKGLI
jgi:hypothetical protein